MPLRKYTSMKFTPAASTRTSISPGPGSGVANSVHFITSGPPVSLIWMACICRLLVVSCHLEQARRPHATADAHGDDHVLDAPSLALDERVPDHASAGHAEGVTDGDCTTIDVEAIHRNCKPVAAIDGLAGECLVELPEPDVVHRETVSFEQARNGEDGTDSHLVGLATRHGEPAVDAE